MTCCADDIGFVILNKSEIPILDVFPYGLKVGWLIMISPYVCDENVILLISPVFDRYDDTVNIFADLLKIDFEDFPGVYFSDFPGKH